MTRRKKLLAIVAVALITALVAFSLVRFASKIYLQKHHSTLLGTAFSLIAPPPDIYSVIWRQSVDRGIAQPMTISFKYAGAYLIRLVGGGGSEDMDGYFECGSMKVDLGFKKKNYSHSEGNYILASFKVEGDMTGRSLQCQVFVSGVGVLTLDVKKISDV